MQSAMPSTRRSPRRSPRAGVLRGVAVAVSVAAMLSLAACGAADGTAEGDTGATPTTAPVTTVAPGPDAETVKVEMSSKANTLYEIGRDGTQTYGQNTLVGDAQVLGETAQVEILGNVDYTKGSGPFFGFLSVRWSDGSSVVFDMDGEAVRDADGTTELRADLRHIGGSGRYVDAEAAAEFRGSRAAAVGSPITIELTLDVTGGAAG